MSKKERCIRKAESYVLANRIAKGIDAYLEAYDSEPTDFHPLVLAGELHIKLEEYPQAIQLLKRAAQGYSAQGRTADTLSIYRKIHKIMPADTEVLLTLAELYFKTHARPDALRFIADAAKRLLEHPGTPPNDESQVLRLIRLVEQANKVNPPDTELVIVQARLYEKAARENEAFALYWQASTTLTQEGKLERSLTLLEHLLKKRPFDMALVEAATGVMTKVGRSLEALSLQKQVLEHDPKNTRLLKVMVSTLIALDYYDEAEQACYKLYGLDKNFYNDFLQFIYLLVSRGDYIRALRGIKAMVPTSTYLQKTELTYIVKRILEQEPNHIDALRALAEIYERYNDITQVLKVYPVLFDLLYRAGNVTDAYQIGQRMLELDYKEENFLKSYDKLFLQIAGGPGVAPLEDAMASSSSAVPEDPTNGKAGDAGARMTWGKQSGPAEGEDSLISSVEILVRYGHYDNAIQVLKTHLEGEPRSVVLHEALKSVYLSTKLLSHAAKECMELYKLYLESGLRDKAQESLREALKLEPTLTLKSLEGGRESGTGFVGDFGLFTIVEVIQFIENSCKSGVLKIVSPTEEGRLYFNNGQVVDASVGDKAGIQALYHLIRVDEGSYEFEPRATKFPEKIRINTTNLLLEGLRLLDEERARKSSAPSSF